MTTDRHSAEYAADYNEQYGEFKRLSPSAMVGVCLRKVRHERDEEQRRVARLRGPRPHVMVDCSLELGPALIKSLEYNLARMNRKVELLEELHELMKDGPRLARGDGA